MRPRKATTIESWLASSAFQRLEQANFDAIARPYRWLEYLTLGRALERSREHFLPQLSDARFALVLGDGDGRFLAKLLALNPSIEVEAVDRSASMLQLLAERCTTYQVRLAIHQTDALTFIPRRTCDLICTHFFLDCLSQGEVELLNARLIPHLQQDALWLVSDFRIPPAGPMHWPARVIVRALYLAFRMVTGLPVTHLPDHASAFAAQGLMLRNRHLSLGGMLTTELWQVKRPRPATSL